jgi:deoxycytidylate deaminase
MWPAKFKDRKVTKEEHHCDEKLAIPCHSCGDEILAQRILDISPEQDRKHQRKDAKHRNKEQLER